MMNLNFIFVLLFILKMTPAALAADFDISSIDKSLYKRIGKRIIINEYKKSKPPALTFSAPQQISKCLLNSKPCDPRQPISLELPSNVKQSYQFQLSYHIQNKQKDALIQIFDNTFPEFAVKGESKISKSLIFSALGNLFIISNKGEIEFFRKDGSSFMIDFRPHKIDGKLYFSALNVDEVNGGFTSTGKRQIFDQNLNLVKEFPEDLDMHDFILKSLDHYISVKYDVDLKKEAKCNVEQSVVEVKNGKIIFEYKISDLLKAGYLYDYIDSFNFRGYYCSHFFHLNGIHEINDGKNLLISVRDNGVFSLDKKTKKIDWFWGGPSDEFSTNPEFLTGGHHQPQFDEKTSTLTVFDNARNTKKSRIFDITLDLKNKTVLKVKPIFNDFGYAWSRGSVQKHNDNIYSIGTGYKGNLDNTPDFIEVYDQKKIFELTFLAKNKLQNPGIYRIYRENLE